jgi:glycosyltransferase involved in cell wall biosynthesis
VLVEALDRIRDRRWTARFVGSLDLDPAWAERIAADIARRGLAGRIDLVGPVENASAAYAGADLFVLPSRYEGYGMAFAEALAHGLPVVAARAGAVPDVVPGDAGILVPPDDPEALAAALAVLVDDKDRRARYRDGARAAAGRFPSWAGTAAVVAGVLGQVETR